MHDPIRTVLLVCAAISFAGWVYAGNELSDALKRKPNPQHGQMLYQSCTACHNADGSGAGKSGIPSIAGQHYQVILKQLVDFRDTERMDLRMEASASKYRLQGAQDLADVAAYIAAMPVKSTTDIGSAKYGNVGRLAYDRACAHCHGARGEGNNRLRYPRLAGQHYTYLLKQIDTMIGGARFNVSWDHAQMLASLTDEEMMGVAHHLARLNTAD